MPSAPRDLSSARREAGPGSSSRSRHDLSAALLWVALLLSALPILADEAGESRPRRITVVFRYDDFAAKSETELESRIIGAFRARGMHCTFGVIPLVAAGSAFDPSPQKGLPLSPEKIAILRDATADGTVEVALHGYSHQTVRLKIGGRFVKRFGRFHSEFFGVDREEQRRKIAEGRRILEEALGLPVKTFIPPWNAYDRNTLEVLADLGFRNFSAARRGMVLPASPLNFVPRTCDVADLQQAVESARRVEDPAPLIVVLFHHYDFVESSPQNGRIDFPRFERLLDWLSRQGDLRTLDIASAANSIPDLGPRRFWWNRNALLWQITPPLLNGLLPSDAKPLYLSLPQARSVKIRLWILVLAIYLGVAVFAGWLASRIVRILSARLPRLARGAVWASPLALASILTVALWDGEPYSGGATAAFFVAGGCVGAWRGAAAAMRTPPAGREKAQR